MQTAQWMKPDDIFVPKRIPFEEHAHSMLDTAMPVSPKKGERDYFA
jgi:hypothetical protein